jgi:hypothetical protein
VPPRVFVPYWTSHQAGLEQINELRADLRHRAKVVVAETDFFIRALYKFAARVDCGRLKKKFIRDQD